MCALPSNVKLGIISEMPKLLRFSLSGLIIIGSAVAAENWLEDDSLVFSVEEKVHELQPTRNERRFDQVGWAPSILAAETRAKELHRPVFLFTYDGKIETGRC